MTKFRNEFHKVYLNVIFSSWWLKNLFQPVIKKFNLTLEQYNVLRIIRGQLPDAVCVKDISSRMLERNSNTTRIIDKLEAKGLVLRTPSLTDKRELRITLTDKGAALLSAIDEATTNPDPIRLGLNETEAQLLNALLDKMRDKE